MELTKDKIIFSRGEDGHLIAQEVILETLPDKPTIRVLPLTRGQLQEIFSKAKSENAEIRNQADTDVLRMGLVSPKLTDEEIQFMKPFMAVAISQAILAVSMNISQTELAQKTEDVIMQQEFELKKK